MRKITNKKRATNGYSITIGWLYPELMSTYGDRGNIICLTKRLQWRNIAVLVKRLDRGFQKSELLTCDIILMGGAQDKQQRIVANDFTTEKTQTLVQVIESEIPGLYVCGAYQFLGRYYKEADGTIINGLGIFDLYTENPGNSYPRLIGNMAFKPSVGLPSLGSQNTTDSLVGFENHGGRTYLGTNVQPFGTVLMGFGNNGIDKTEGAIYKNSFGSYCHGPLLPKNPHLADFLLQKAIEKKYGKTVQLKPLDDTLELKAHQAIAKRLGVAV